MNVAGTQKTLLWKKKLLKTFQYHVTWNVTPRPFFRAKPSIDERDYTDLLKEFKPFKLLWVMAYIKRETPVGSLAYVLLQKNVVGTHFNPKFGTLGKKDDVLFYVEVQKKVADKKFEGDDYFFVFPEPLPLIDVDDSFNMNLKASNSSWRLRTVDFLVTLGIDTV